MNSHFLKFGYIKQVSRLTFIIFFLSLIYSNTILTFLNVEFVKNFSENRRTAPPPSIFSSNPSLLNIKSFFKEMDLFIKDHFSYRKPLIIFYNKLKYHIFNSSSNSDALPAKNGWIFYGTPSMIQDYTRKNPLPYTYLKELELSFKKRKIWLEKMGIHFLVLIVPNKHNIYSNYMPDYYLKGKGLSNGEQLNYLLESEIPGLSINIFPDFLRRARTQQLYYKTDTHWNNEGAKITVEAILNQLSTQKNHISFRTIPPIIENKNFFSKGNFGTLMGINLREPEVVLIPKNGWNSKSESVSMIKKNLPENCEVELKINPKAPPTRVLVIGDSYIARFDNYLAEAFGWVMFINPWNSKDNSRFPTTLIKETKPNLVIYLFGERRLADVMGSNYHLNGNNPEEVNRVIFD